jgi:chemotaxis response regulator CheB
MNKDRNKRNAAEADAAAVGNFTGETECPVIVVGIGASAGGLTSLQQLVARMPPGHRVAFVLIQHLEPSRYPLEFEKDQSPP